MKSQLPLKEMSILVLRDGNVFVWLGFLSYFSEKLFIGR